MTHPILRPLAALTFAGLVFLALHAVVRGELPTVTAVLETRPSFGDHAGGNADADDPAIWVDPKDPTRSFVVATLKEGGLDVYDLSGSLVQHIAPEAAPPGMALNSARYNNVDLIYGFKLRNQKVDLAVASDRYNDMIRVFAIDPTALATGGDPLTEITAPDQPWIFVDTERSSRRPTPRMAWPSPRAIPTASTRSRSSAGARSPVWPSCSCLPPRVDAWATR